jgi:hypothetical protein
MHVVLFLSCVCSLIGVLLLGYVDDSGHQRHDQVERDQSYLLAKQQITKQEDGGFAMPAPRPPKVVPSMLPKEEEEDVDVDPLGKK